MCLTQEKRKKKKGTPTWLKQSVQSVSNTRKKKKATPTWLKQSVSDTRKKKKGTPTLKQSGSDTRKKKAKKGFLKHQIYHVVTYFTVFIGSFCFVPSLTLFSLFFFPFYYFFHHFHLYSLYYFIVNARKTTNFTIYILRIDMSPITKNNFKNLFIIYCLSNTNNIFTKSVCKRFVVNLVV